MVVKRRDSISGKLVMGFSFSLAVLIFILTAVICSRLKRENRASFEQERDTNLSLVGNTIASVFDSIENTLSMLTENESVRTADDSIYSLVDAKGNVKVYNELIKTPKGQELVSLFKNVYSTHPEYVEVYLGTKWGGYATSFDGEMSGGYDPRQRGWYKQGLASNGKVIITDAYASTVGDVVVGLAKTAYDVNNSLIGVVGVEITLKTITDLISASKVGKTGFFMAVENSGVILADPRHSTYIFKTLEDTGVEDLKNLTDKTSGTYSVKMDGKRWLAQVRTIDNPNWKLIAFMEEREVLSDYIYTVRVMMILGFTLLFLFAVGTALFALKLLRPMSSFMDVIEKISKGDFTSKLRINTRDEFYVMAERFNIALDNIKSAMTSVHSSTAQVLSAEDALVSNMTETASSIKQIHTNLDEVKQQTETQASSVTETTATMVEIISSIGSLNNSIERQSLRLSESSSSIQKMLGSMDSISNILKENEALINTLFEKTSKGKQKVLEAGKVTEKIEEESENLLEASTVIQSVARNTNLLAMNAAIEAAHVGKEGKGFAVVSDEIRKLAQDSDSQGKRIAEVIQESLDIIRNLAVVKKEEEAVFSEIYSMAETVLKKQKILIEAVSEISSGNREVLSGIAELSNVTEQVKKGSKEMLQGSEAVSNEMTRLNNLTNEINDRMTEMASNVVQINGAVQEVGNISQLCTESMTDLSEKVKKFKV